MESPGKAASLLQSSGYRTRIRILLKTNPLAVAKVIDVRNGDLERRPAGFALTPVLTQDDHPVPIVHHVLSGGSKLLIVCRDEAKKSVDDALWPSMDTTKGIVGCLGDIPHDVRVHCLQDGG